MGREKTKEKVIQKKQEKLDKKMGTNDANEENEGNSAKVPWDDDIGPRRSH